MHTPRCADIGSIHREIIQGHEHTHTGGIDQLNLMRLVQIKAALPEQLSVADEPEGARVVLPLYTIQRLTGMINKTNRF